MPLVISDRFDTPFFGGSGSLSDVLVPFFAQVAIDGRVYIIDPLKYQRATMQAVRQPVDQSVEPGEQTLNSEGLWRRSQENWILGAGQLYLDNRASTAALFTRNAENQSLRYRFWKSWNVDIWSENGLTLLPEVSGVKSPVTSDTNHKLLVAGDFLYHMFGSTLEWTNDATPDAPTMSDSNIQAGEGAQGVVDITTDGSVVYAALGGNGIHKTTVGSTASTHLSAYDPDILQYANGHLIACSGKDIVEVNADGSTTALASHKNASWKWSSITGAANGIYLAGFVGSVGEVWYLGFDTTTGALNTFITLATSLPKGEVPNVLDYYGGLVIIGTSMGLRISDITRADNGLVYGPVIEIANGITAVDAFDEFVWFSMSNQTFAKDSDPNSTQTTTGLGRADLARFTSQMVPAWNTDVQIIEQ